MPLSEFDEEKQASIAALVALPDPPEKQIYFGTAGDLRPHATIPSRAWYEWHWQRDIDPDKIREHIPQQVRRSVIRRDGHVCQICRLDVAPDDIHLDHIVPFSKGGRDNPGNLRVTHSTCNMRRGNRS